MVTINNDFLTVTIKEKGAEITSIIDNKTGYQYIWQADEDYWNRHAPILFPIVGNLKDNQYTYKGNTYQLSRHGFARDLTFHTQKVTANSASFYLKSNSETLEHYPFAFSLQVTYILHQSQVTVSYEVLNPDSDETIYYSVGGHPAFNVSQTKSGEFDNIYLSFEPEGHYLRIPLTKNGLTQRSKAKYENMNGIKLTREIFKSDALIYQIGRQTEIALVDQEAGIEIRMKPNRMEFVGIWSTYPKQGGFVCLEPWSGIADDSNTSGELTQKYSIIELLPNQLMMHDYSIDFINHK